MTLRTIRSPLARTHRAGREVEREKKGHKCAQRRGPRKQETEREGESIALEEFAGVVRSTLHTCVHTLTGIYTRGENKALLALSFLPFSSAPSPFAFLSLYPRGPSFFLSRRFELNAPRASMYSPPRRAALPARTHVSLCARARVSTSLSLYPDLLVQVCSLSVSRGTLSQSLCFIFIFFSSVSRRAGARDIKLIDDDDFLPSLVIMGIGFVDCLGIIEDSLVHSRVDCSRTNDLFYFMKSRRVIISAVSY